MPRVIKNVTKLPESSPIDENRVKTTPILKESGEPTVPLEYPSLDKDIEESPREGGAGETVGFPASFFNKSLKNFRKIIKTTILLIFGRTI